MAIIDEFEVTLSSNGQLLREHEYKVEHEMDASPTLSANFAMKKYIEVHDGCRFSVNIHVPKGYIIQFPNATDLAWDLYFDGKHVLGRYHSRSDIESKGLFKSVSSVEAEFGDKVHVNHFKFDLLDISEEKISRLEAKQYKGYGTIELKIWPYRRGPISGNHIQQQYRDLPVVPKKGVKPRAVTLGVGSDLEVRELPSEVRQSNNGQYTSCYPLAHFTFEYRTRESLEYLRVIVRPRVYGGDLPLAEQEPSTLNAEELLQHVKMQRTKVKIEMKRERSVSTIGGDGVDIDGNDDDDDEVITLGSAKKVKTTMNEEDAIIID